MISAKQKENIEILINSFKKDNGHQKSEEHIQSLFTIKLLEILGWQTSHFKINKGQDVSTGRKPDILLQDNGDTLIVIESKEASTSKILDGYYQKLGKKTTFINQVLGYCRAEGVFWGILTNFIEWRVYNTFQNRLYLNKKYAFRDLLWDGAEKKNYTDLLSPAGLEFLDKLQMENIVKTKGIWDNDPIYYPLQEEIKDKFFEDLKQWRILLSENIKLNNKKIDAAVVEASAQKIIDRLIFIDYCADNKIVSQDRLHASLEARSNIYGELKKIFHDMDEKFNSELFAPNPIDQLIVTDDALRPIILSLADIDFSELSVNVIGEVYEKYLGEIQRAGQGIYYTPEHIVNYIVENTVGVILAECKNIAEIEKIRVLDPACGSGSFLIRIFDEFLKHYKRFEDAPLYEFNLRKKILLNNIFGVDLDERAIEITKLNLLVKALEGAARINIDGQKILPNIKLNVRCGNSIVSGSTVTKDLELFWKSIESESIKLENLHTSFGSEVDENKQIDIYDEIMILEASLNRNLNQNLPTFTDIDAVRPFNYEVAFPQILKNGGFDCVIGNPPYIDSEAMTLQQPEVRNFASANMKFTRGNWDIYIAFFDRAFALTKDSGFIGFITPDKWVSKKFGETFRKHTTKNIMSLMRAGRKVFKDAKVDAIVSIFSKKRNLKLSIYEASKLAVIERITVRKTTIKPSYEYDHLFSPYVEVLNKISEAGNTGRRLYLCENACSTSDCYKLAPYIVSHPTTTVDSKKYYKIVNTGTIGRFESRWDSKQMTYLKNKYTNPVVDKAVFHKEFTNTYAEKSKKAKLIIKGLTLLDIMIDYNGEYIPGKTTLVITADTEELLEYFSALFSSKIAFFYIAEQNSSSSYNGGITFSKVMFNNFPVVNPTDELLKKISGLVKSIMKETDILATLSGEKHTKQAIQVKSLQRDIDAEFYKIYKLTDEEIDILDKYTNKKPTKPKTPKAHKKVNIK